jgi:hypothetical protein
MQDKQRNMLVQTVCFPSANLHYAATLRQISTLPDNFYNDPAWFHRPRIRRIEMDIFQMIFGRNPQESV